MSPRSETPAVVLVGWDDEDATRLRTAQQAELRERYGDDDIGHEMTGEQIVAMLVVREDDEPVACVALRDASEDLGPGVGEIKRLYTVPAARGRGHSRRAVVELERVARERGVRRLVLETGVLQPEAIGLYLALGHRPIDNYAEYVDEPSSRCFAKDLSDEAADRPAARGGSSRPPRRPVTVQAVPWGDPDGTALRRAMFAFNSGHYPALYADLAGEPDGGFASDDERQGVGVLATWVARIDGRAVGCVTLRAARDGYPAGSVELKKLFVDDAARGAGAARALLAAAEDDARSRGLASVVLCTGTRQPEAITLYLSAGYRPVRPFTDPAGDFWTFWFAKPLA
ncbi:GNAT family N-acetyltransferase [Cellulomonas sp. DKR-3]|uniref:GNAT family N-acetyltransferase n=1 Tax=Cellulomonas fulva TaxID=2835530 RepID=A0ABS5TXZ2_9CELL|nr:GNAT family N-acetyltransferase [Cellulomonas fulva]MBT0994019.1 GNAT family N-acetyltransferase [Cellulomonas fulva]